MKRKTLRILPAVLFCLFLFSALADVTPGYVVQLDLPYGDTAYEMHMSETPLSVDYDGRTWSFDDKYASFQEAFQVFGGKTHAIYEMTVPENRHNGGAFEGDLKLGVFSISGHEKLHLQILAGNRMSGEFVLIETRDLVDPYVETVTIPRDETGSMQVIDRVYLYSFEVNGEEQYYAASLYFDYENYVASHGPRATAVPTPEPTEEPTPEPTAEPTVEPTAEPTAEPTPEPTAKPTPEPTEVSAAEAVTATPEPTAQPTPESDEPAAAASAKTSSNLTTILSIVAAVVFLVLGPAILSVVLTVNKRKAKTARELREAQDRIAELERKAAQQNRNPQDQNRQQ